MILASGAIEVFKSASFRPNGAGMAKKKAKNMFGGGEEIRPFHSDSVPRGSKSTQTGRNPVSNSFQLFVLIVPQTVPCSNPGNVLTPDGT